MSDHSAGLQTQEPPSGFGRRLFGAVEFVANAMLVLMVLAILFQVVARYAFAHPPFWTEELARYAMIWCGALGAALAFWRMADPRFLEPDVLFGGARLRTGMLIALIPAAIFAGALLYECLFGPGRDLTRGFMARNFSRVSEGLQINMAFVATAIPTMAALILIAGVLHALAILKGGRSGGA